MLCFHWSWKCKKNETTNYNLLFCAFEVKNRFSVSATPCTVFSEVSCCFMYLWQELKRRPDMFVFPVVSFLCFLRFMCLFEHVLVFVRFQSSKTWWIIWRCKDECKMCKMLKCISKTGCITCGFWKTKTYILKRRKKKDNYEAFC